jgi:uncharacterized SAM-binding protein YcdF (DUF218 family)
MDLVSLRWLLSNLLLPPAAPLLLAVAGLALLLTAGARGSADGGARGGTGGDARGADGGLRGVAARGGSRARAGRVLLAIGLASAWLTSMPLGAQLIARWVEGDLSALTDERLREELAGPRPPGAIVILAGGVTHDERERPHRDSVNALTLQRLAQGARIARLTGLPMLLSGGRAPDREYAEAALMARVLEESLGLSARWIEDTSRDTAGNARLTAERLRAAGVGRIVLVTQAYHMRRSQAAFEAAGLEVLAAPHGFMGGVKVDGIGSFLPSAGAVRTSWLALHEALGLVWYRLRGHVQPG